MTDLHPVRRALLSVSDKTGLIEAGQGTDRTRGRTAFDRWHSEGVARCGA